MKIAEAEKVFDWPEFRALAERLGIDLTQPIARLVIEIELSEAVRIEQQFLGRDTFPNET